MDEEMNKLYEYVIKEKWHSYYNIRKCNNSLVMCYLYYKFLSMIVLVNDILKCTYVNIFS